MLSTGSISSHAPMALFFLACALPTPAFAGAQVYLRFKHSSATSQHVDVEWSSRTVDQTVDVTHQEPSGYQVVDLPEKSAAEVSPAPPPKLPKNRWSSILKPKPSLSNFGYTYGQPFTERPAEAALDRRENRPRPATVMLLPSHRFSFVSARLPQQLDAAKALRRASAPVLQVQPGIEDRYRLSSQTVGQRSSYGTSLTPRQSQHRFSQYSDNSPATRSVHDAQLRTAQRAKISAPPLMLGPAPPPRSPAASSAQLRASGALEDPSMFADAPEGDDFVAPRMSTDTFGRPERDDEQPEPVGQPSVAKRRSFDLAKWLPGSKAKATQDIEMKTIAPKHAASASMATSESHARTSCSTNRESLDLPPFRPSLDFIPVPPIPAKYATPNMAAGRASLDFANPDAVQSTPKGTPVSKDHKHNISLSHLASPNFMNEMKGYLEDFAKTPKHRRVALLQTPRDTPSESRNLRKTVLTKRSDDSIGPVRGILKRKTSTESNFGHELPPIPVEISVALRRPPKTSDSSALSVESVAEIPIRMRLSGNRQYVLDPEQLPVVPEGEETGHVAAIVLPRSRFSTDVPASIGHDDLSFQEDQDVVDEMEKFLTSMESPQTSAYMGDLSNGNSLTSSAGPVSLQHADLSTHNAAAALRRQNSKESLKLAKVMSRKQSSDAVSTAYTRDSSDLVESLPSATPLLSKRSSQRLSSRPTSYAGGKTISKLDDSSKENSNRHSLPSEPKSSEMGATTGLRPLRMLGQLDGNVSGSKKSSTTPSVASARKKGSTTASIVSGGRKSSDQERSSQRWSVYEDPPAVAKANKKKPNARVLE